MILAEKNLALTATRCRPVETQHQSVHTCRRELTVEAEQTAATTAAFRL